MNGPKKLKKNKKKMRNSFKMPRKEEKNF